ncbi:hypothetical protein OZ411_01195 [Bradyrhizobium sp. Arg237L]|uniref:hypothetical protein n=1 Tax=Bradyrhizobium sp. Arg237L TaxID=3003352 RepID=UPI00249DB8E5|nr:hypothetical protein [Bradyrhizobium sp. Arg237L]MDI4231428.1 hypothetical protein [Bradyrhizobium sp. Arg237L]
MTQAEIKELLDRFTITPDELHRSRIFPLTRSGVYEAIRRGEIQVIEFGKKKAILTAPLREKLGLR